MRSNQYHSRTISCSQAFRHALYSPVSTLSCKLSSLESQNQTKELQEAQVVMSQLRDLLAFCDRQTDIKCEVNARAVILKTVALFNVSFPKIRVIVNNLPSTIINGHEIIWQEILLCLLSNAAQAYGNSANPGIIYLSASILNNHWQLVIADFGCGLSWWQQVRLSVKNMSFKPDGHGIGLKYVKDTLHELGGKIDLISKRGLGTKVVVSIKLDTQTK